MYNMKILSSLSNRHIFLSSRNCNTGREQVSVKGKIRNPGRQNTKDTKPTASYRNVLNVPTARTWGAQEWALANDNCTKQYKNKMST